jgi:hypothetical protein
VLKLRERSKLDEEIQWKAHGREIWCGLVARIEVLMPGTVWDLERAAFAPVEALGCRSGVPMIRAGSCVKINGLSEWQYPVESAL